jgi:hypothetical protein
MSLVVCTYCGAKVRADRLTKHIAKVHPASHTASVQGSKKWRKFRREGGAASPALPSTFDGSSMKDWDFD